MNSSLRWKLILAFALVFLAGAASGFFGAVHFGIMLFHHQRPGPMAEHMKQHLRDELKLTPQQVDKIAPIVDHATASLEAKREETAREVHAIFEEMHARISPLLTDEQRERLRRMEERHRQMMRRHDGHPPPPPD
ncbi:MAG: hypothetical protein DLM52_11445 [Chthoniobacterales bacterium]|nr:MAG: hypothetical protein DLM52_11445 [Chthoniobacterales bacterium]